MYSPTLIYHNKSELNILALKYGVATTKDNGKRKKSPTQLKEELIRTVRESNADTSNASRSDSDDAIWNKNKTTKYNFLVNSKLNSLYALRSDFPTLLRDMKDAKSTYFSTMGRLAKKKFHVGVIGEGNYSLVLKKLHAFFEYQNKNKQNILKVMLMLSRKPPPRLKSTTIEYAKGLLKNGALTKLLLNGLGIDHAIDPVDAKTWIKSQMRTNQHTAKRIIETNRYINHEEFMDKLYKLMTKLFIRLDGTEYVMCLDISNTEKSNYWMYMVFLAILTNMPHKLGSKSYFPLDAGTYDNMFKKYKYNMSYVDLDDMSYSGNQTFRNLRGTIYKNALEFIPQINDISMQLLEKQKPIFAKQCRTLFTNQIDAKNKNKSSKQEFFFPNHIVNGDFLRHAMSAMSSTFNYHCCRVFISTSALCKFNSFIDNKQVTLINPTRTYVFANFNVVFSEVIPMLKEQVSDKDYNAITARFNGQKAAMNVHFDHKIADGVSTLLLPLSTGLIPDNTFYDNSTPHNGIAYHGFIKNCKQFRGTFDGLHDMGDKLDENQSSRCPYAYYKNIDYIKGSLREITLPETHMYFQGDAYRVAWPLDLIR